MHWTVPSIRHAKNLLRPSRLQLDSSRYALMKCGPQPLVLMLHMKMNSDDRGADAWVVKVVHVPSLSMVYKSIPSQNQFASKS